MNQIYSSIRDVESRVVVPALGDYADEYDTLSIARAVAEYRRDPHPYRKGAEYATGSYVLRDDVDFWVVAEQHAL